MAIELDWEVGNPSLPGLYFVAVKMGEYAGVYDFMVWDGKTWESDHPVNIIAFVDIQKFKNALNVKWPIEESLDYQSSALSVREDDLWSEG